MYELMNLCEMLCEELSDYGRKNEISGGDLEVIDKLAHATKNVFKVMESKEEMVEDGYSNRGSSYATNGGGSYRGNSYARGKNARRDSMGRYSNERGYSRDAEDMIEQLKDMERTAMDERTRSRIHNLIAEFEDR